MAKKHPKPKTKKVTLSGAGSSELKTERKEQCKHDGAQSEDLEPRVFSNITVQKHLVFSNTEASYVYMIQHTHTFSVEQV